MAEDVKIVNDSKTCLSRNRVIKRGGGGVGYKNADLLNKS